MLFLLHFACSEYDVGSISKGPSFDSAAQSETEASQTESSDAEDAPQDIQTTLPPDDTSIATEPSDEPDIPDLTGGFDPGSNPTISTKLTGNVVTILMSLSDDWLEPAVAQRLLDNAVRFSSPVENPRILIIRDDNHHGENQEDPEQIETWLNALGFETVIMNEPQDGIRSNILGGFHVVIFSNPGHPIDDLSSLNSLHEFSIQGFGVIFQGDDITTPLSPLLEQLTRLQYIDNGVSYHGVSVDNNQGAAYEVWIENDTPLSDGISGSFIYGNDIDTTRPLEDLDVVAWCTIAGEDFPPKPVITAFQYDGVHGLQDGSSSGSGPSGSSGGGSYGGIPFSEDDKSGGGCG